MKIVSCQFRGAGIALAAALAGGCGDGEGPGVALNVKPASLGSVAVTAYDGASDDLLTAGLGRTGLASATAPGYADPARPTAAELRRTAIYNNYRAIVDMSASGGYGTLYGPNVDAAGTATAGEGKVAGTEYIALSDDGSGRRNVTLMVQLPASFDPANPCIVTATASGSRGVYGGISTGEWGLRRGCAVAYTDKGTGAAPHDLAADTVPLVDGTRTTAAAAGTAAHFNAGLAGAELAAFNAATPNRYAFKHAHSRQNPEKDWGRSTLQAIEFAFSFYVINERYAGLDASGARLRDFRAGNTIVIASSISNGGGAALAAAEQDEGGLISGVAVSEPVVELPADPGVSLRRGAAPVAVSGRTLYDYTTVANLYQSCASQSSQVADAPGRAFVVASRAAARCNSLKAKGLLAADTTAAQADEALQKLRGYGWDRESDVLHASLAAFEVAPAVAVTFANALARASVAEHLCGYSYAATTGAGAVTTLASTALAQMVASGNGVPPTSGVQLVNNLHPGGALRDLLSSSPSTGAGDFNLDGAICLRNLVAGSGGAAARLQAGVDETRRSGNLRGKPALIVHGRSDGLIPVSHTSRPYFALNKRVEGASSRLSYLEVTNAQHFDAFIPALAGYDTRYIPLHVYLFRALDAMYAHLKTGAALPASQVVRTLPRGGTPGSAPAITAAHVPPVPVQPAAADAIVYAGTTVTVPH